MWFLIGICCCLSISCGVWLFCCFIGSISARNLSLSVKKKVISSRGEGSLFRSDVYIENREMRNLNFGIAEWKEW